MYGGDGADTITYDTSAGNDRAFIDGGRGEDGITINSIGKNFTVYRAYIKKIGKRIKVFYKKVYSQVVMPFDPRHSIIKVKDIEHGTIIGNDGNPVYQW